MIFNVFIFIFIFGLLFKPSTWHYFPKSIVGKSVLFLASVHIGSFCISAFEPCLFFFFPTLTFDAFVVVFRHHHRRRWYWCCPFFFLSLLSICWSLTHTPSLFLSNHSIYSISFLWRILFVWEKKAHRW